MNYVCLSAYYLEIDSLNAAEKYATEATFTCENLGFIRGKLYSLAAQGDVAFKKGNIKKALDYFKEFTSIPESSDDPFMIAEIKSKIGLVHKELKNNITAIQNFKESISIFQSLNTMKNVMDTHKELSNLYAITGDSKKAYNHLFLKDSIKSASFDQETQKQIREIEAKYKTEKQEALNNQLLAEQELSNNKVARQKDYLYGAGLGLVLISLLSLVLYRQSKKRKVLNKVLSNQKEQIKTLNKELHHRVKNNLTFMTSLLEMQGRRSETEETKLVLNESKNRLLALSEVHTSLFQNEENTNINLRNYLKKITNHLGKIFEVPGKSLLINKDFIDYNMNAEDAMRFGLIINELVTNSAKHAFTGIDNATINIKTSININGKLELQYKDNGPGVIKSVTENQSASLGMKLIDLLKKQLEDKYVITLIW